LTCIEGERVNASYNRLGHVRHWSDNLM